MHATFDRVRGVELPRPRMNRCTRSLRINAMYIHDSCRELVKTGRDAEFIQAVLSEK